MSLTTTTVILLISRFNLHQVRSSICLITRLLTFESNRRTVSGVHARLEKKGGTLLITDLDSTNGTYIDDKKLRPGAVTTVPPGSCITFGNHTQKLPFHCITYSSVKVHANSFVMLHGGSTSVIDAGDTHLAMFRVSKIEQEDVTGEGDDKSEIETKAETTINGE